MINIYKASVGEYEEINNFHNQVDGKRRSLEAFMWEFEQNPFGDSIYVIARHGDKIVGTNALIPICFSNGSRQKILTAKSEDTLIDPHYRGQKIFEKLYEVLIKEAKNACISAIWGYTPAVKAFQRIGFSIPFVHSQSLMVFNPFSAYKYLSLKNEKNSWFDKLKILGLSFYALKRKGSIETGNVVYKKYEKEIPGSIKNLQEKMMSLNRGMHTIDRSSEYISWRILNNPYLLKPTFHTFSIENKTVVSAISAQNKEGICYLSDFLFDPELDMKTTRSILRNLASQIFRAGAIAIRNWHFSHNSLNILERSIFSSAGFVLIERGQSFVWLPLSPDTPDFSKFHLTRLSTQGLI